MGDDRGARGVQWDPERDLTLAALPYRAIQIELSGEAVDRYADDWIVAIGDVTPTAHQIAALVHAGRLDEARAALPDERAYPVAEPLRERLGMAPSPLPALAARVSIALPADYLPRLGERLIEIWPADEVLRVADGELFAALGEIQ